MIGAPHPDVSEGRNLKGIPGEKLVKILFLTQEVIDIKCVSGLRRFSEKFYRIGSKGIRGDEGAKTPFLT